MHKLFLAIVAVLTLGASAGAVQAAGAFPNIEAPPHADGFPDIPVYTRYDSAFKTLAKAGIVPVRILSDGRTCGGDQPNCNNNMISCLASPPSYCEDLYIRLSDNKLFIVAHQPEYAFRLSAKERRRRGYPYGGYDAYIGPWPSRTALKHLQEYDLLIVMPNGKRRKFGEPERRTQKWDDDHTPLCSSLPEGRGIGNCWVKPPKGYKPPNAVSGSPSH